MKAGATMKVYIAASSVDIDRAKNAAIALEAAGVEVVSTWWFDVETVGDANPADLQTRFRCSLKDIDEVSRADVVWFLVPEIVYSHGAFFEIGFAYAQGIKVFASGNTSRSIFLSLAYEYATDDEAFVRLARLANGDR